MEETIKNTLINNIKSKFVIKKILSYIKKKKLLEIIKYNKNLQKICYIGINDYKYFNSVEVELIPIYKKDKNVFINLKRDDEFYHQFYHIYFNDDINEQKRDYFTKNDNIKKIKIILDKQIKSFWKLFYECDCIEK